MSFLPTSSCINSNYLLFNDYINPCNNHEYNKIGQATNIFVQQGTFGRILNCSSIGISSPEDRGVAIGFLVVSDLMKIKAIIEDTFVKYKKNL